MMRINNLEELRVLQAVMEQGSVAAAAEHLGMPPRTVGRRLAALEDRLGTVLIPRTTRTMGATPTTRRFVDRCAKALQLLAEAEDLLSADQGEIKGSVRIAVPSLWASEILQASKRLGLRFPQIALTIDVTDRPLPALQGSPVDVALTVHKPSHGQDVCKRVHRPIQASLAASPTYLHQHPAPERPEDLKHHECLRFTGFNTWTLTKATRQVDVEVNGRIQSGDSRLLRDAVVSGFGIGPITNTKIDDHRLVRVLPRWSWPGHQFWIVISPTNHKLTRVGVVVRWLEDLMT